MRNKTLSFPIATEWTPLTLPANLAVRSSFIVVFENGSAGHICNVNDDSEPSIPIRENSQGVGDSGFIPKGEVVCYAKVTSGTDTAKLVVSL